MPGSTWLFASALHFYDSSYAELLSTMLVFDLDTPQPETNASELENFTSIFESHVCAFDHVWMGRYLPKGSQLIFDAMRLQQAPWGSIAVRQRLPPPSLDWQDVPCQFLVQNSSALERHVCDIAEDGFYMYQLEGIPLLNLTVANCPYTASAHPLCVGPCSIPVDFSWHAKDRRLLFVPNLVECEEVPVDQEEGTIFVAPNWGLLWLVWGSLHALLVLLLIVAWAATVLLKATPRVAAAGSLPDGKPFTGLLSDGPPSQPDLPHRFLTTWHWFVFWFLILGPLGAHRLYLHCKRSRPCALVILRTVVLAPLRYLVDGLHMMRIVFHTDATESLSPLRRRQLLKAVAEALRSEAPAEREASPACSLTPPPPSSAVDVEVVSSSYVQVVLLALLTVILQLLLYIRVLCLLLGFPVPGQFFAYGLLVAMPVVLAWALWDRLAVLYSPLADTVVIVRQRWLVREVWCAPLSVLRAFHADLEWLPTSLTVTATAVPPHLLFTHRRWVSLAPWRPFSSLLPHCAALCHTTLNLVGSPGVGEQLRSKLQAAPLPLGLPHDLWQLVGAWLALCDVAALGAVCRALGSLTLQDDFWASREPPWAVAPNPSYHWLCPRGKAYLWHRLAQSAGEGHWRVLQSTACCDSDELYLLPSPHAIDSPCPDPSDPEPNPDLGEP
eukprot:EG_transcript_4916